MRHLIRFARSVPLLLALLSAVLFGSAGEAGCTMHGLGAMPHRAVSGHHAAGRAHAASSDVIRHEHQSSDEHGHHGQDSRGHCCCSCISECSFTAPLATLPAVHVVLVAVVVPQPRQTFDAQRAELPPPEPDLRLPFANGPPAAPLA
jgi:hypothetical protein